MVYRQAGAWATAKRAAACRLAGVRTLKLRDGTAIPAFGLGTWLSAPGEVYRAVRHALEVGYRHFDCAWIYQNEPEIGHALADAFAAGDVRREDLWVTSKLWNDKHAPEDVAGALAGTLRDLRLEYLDLYLMHWPVAHRPGVVRPREPGDFIHPEELPIERTWEAMLALRGAGVRHVGVSNFSSSKIERVSAATGEAPAVNQIELHPFLQQRELLAAMAARGVVATAYSPLGSGGRPDGMRRPDERPVLEHPTVIAIAQAHAVSPAQVLLAWALQRGTSVIPKSTQPARIADNFRAQALQLEEVEMAQIAALERAERYVTGAFWCPPGSPHTVESLWA
jgi:alcohol dehydrogenase (NADP+)